MGSSSYNTLCSPWPTYVDGRPLLGKSADLAVIDARLGALGTRALEELCLDLRGEGLIERGWAAALSALSEGRAQFPNIDWDDEAALAIFREAGATSVRETVRRVVTTLCEHPDEYDFRYDGRRWFVEPDESRVSDGHSAFKEIRTLEMSGIAQEPLDGPEFDDRPAVGAAVAVIDDLAAAALRAVQDAGVSDEVLDAVRENLEAARCDVGGVARMLRVALDAGTEHDQVAMWATYRDLKQT